LFCKKAGSVGVNAVKLYLRRLWLVSIATILSKTLKIQFLFLSAIPHNWSFSTIFKQTFWSLLGYHTTLSHSYEYTHFYHFKPFLREQHIFVILCHSYECASFLLFQAILSSAPHFYQFKPFLRMQHIFVILRHSYECASFLPF